MVKAKCVGALHLNRHWGVSLARWNRGSRMGGRNGVCSLFRVRWYQINRADVIVSKH